MTSWFELSEEDRKNVINQVATRKGLLPTAVEKDWWVMIALRAIFRTEYALYLVFKGGTSLSKSWNIIERFSEDIDLAIDRNFLGHPGNLSRKDVTRLRRASCSFVVEKFQHVLAAQLAKGVSVERQL